MMINDKIYILTNFEYALESKSIKPFFNCFYNHSNKTENYHE